MPDLASYLDKIRSEPEPFTSPTPEPPPPANEIIVDKKTGAVRQAGADGPGAWITDFKRACEKDLYTFLRGVLGRKDLTETLHKPLCQGLTAFPPRRKLRLLPRHHRKTSIVSQGLPLHMAIQPAADNLYFPGEPGTHVRVLLSGETEKLAAGNLRVIQNVLESNKILRGLWPNVVWDKPRTEAKKWNEIELILRRDVEFPEATITARGVGGAITGLHPNVLIKDDLISLEARNSNAVMQTAIEWHTASRGLIEGNDSALEYIIGTRWAKFDLYSFIIDQDDTMDVGVRAMIEEGEFIYPEKFNAETADRLRKELGNELYSLLYLNVATGVGLTDFDMDEVRAYALRGREIVFDSDERDAVLEDRVRVPGLPVSKYGADADRDFSDPRMYGGAHRLRYG